MLTETVNLERCKDIISWYIKTYIENISCSSSVEIDYSVGVVTCVSGKEGYLIDADTFLFKVKVPLSSPIPFVQFTYCKRTKEVEVLIKTNNSATYAWLLDYLEDFLVTLVCIIKPIEKMAAALGYLGGRDPGVSIEAGDYSLNFTKNIPNKTVVKVELPAWVTLLDKETNKYKVAPSVINTGFTITLDKNCKWVDHLGVRRSLPIRNVSEAVYTLYKGPFLIN